MNFEWAKRELAKGKKVREATWDNPNSYIFVKDRVVYSHKNTKAYFFLDSFFADDWELYESSSMKTADKEGKFYCSTCKKEVKFGDKFCKNCGGAQMWALFG